MRFTRFHVFVCLRAFIVSFSSLKLITGGGRVRVCVCVCFLDCIIFACKLGKFQQKLPRLAAYFLLHLSLTPFSVCLFCNPLKMSEGRNADRVRGAHWKTSKFKRKRKIEFFTFKEQRNRYASSCAIFHADTHAERAAEER